MGKGSEFDFASNTFFFGSNAKGKSTLTSILLSLSLNEPSYVVGRKTFGADNQEINIEFFGTNAPTYTFSPTGWNKSFPEIVIFDSRFVEKNVYLGDSLTEDHEKAIETIILGEKGSKLEGDFNKADTECQKNSLRKSEITREFTRHLGHMGIDFDNFRKLKLDRDIDDKINKKENEIKAYGQQQKVRDKLNELINVVNFDNLLDFKTKLKPTISLHQEKIKNHILNHLKVKEDAETFLAKGTDLLRDQDGLKQRNCVFCGQLLVGEAKELIESYEMLFSNLYKELTKAIAEAKNFFIEWKIEADLRRLSSELLSLGIQINFDKKIKDINNLTGLFKEELVKKSDLNYAINFSYLQKIVLFLREISTEVKKVQTKYSSKFDENRYRVLLNEKASLELIKKRAEKSWVELCKEYESLEIKTKKLIEIRQSTLNKKNKYAESILSNYEIEVNKILKDLQADFELIDTKPKVGLRSSQALFGITFGSHKIALSGYDNLPNFGNTLSESDKRLLAFAFFISCLKIQGNIKDKIVVLDDPLSSLDEERRLKTVNLLNSFISTEKPRQLIILTHDKFFFSLLSKLISQHKSFKILYNPKLGSSIVVMEPNEEFLDTYYKQVEELKELELAPDSEITWEKLRPVRDILEQLFKRKYYLHFKEIKDGGSISAFVEKLKIDKVYNEVRAREIENLIPHFWNHDDSDSIIKKSDIATGDIRGVIKNFFKVMELV